MTTDPRAVIGRGEIILDGKRYPLIGNQQVGKSVASNFPEKRIEGDATPENHPLISSINWSNLTGGGGLAQITGEPGDLNRAT